MVYIVASVLDVLLLAVCVLLLLQRKRLKRHGEVTSKSRPQETNSNSVPAPQGDGGSTYENGMYSVIHPDYDHNSHAKNDSYMNVATVKGQRNLPPTDWRGYVDRFQRVEVEPYG